MTAWLAVAGAGAVSFLLRFVPVLLLRRSELRGWLRDLSSVSSPIAFASLTAASVAVSVELGVAALAARLVALAVAAAVVLRTRSTAATLGAGMATLWLLTALPSL